MRPQVMFKLLTLVLGMVMLGACSMAPVHVSKVEVSPPSLMVAKKLSRPLFIVLDPERVPDYVHIPQSDVKEVHVHELRTFVRRDVKKAMETFFQRVEVVEPGYAFPSEPHYVADIKIDKLGTRFDKATSGGYTAGRVFGTMTWSFAIRPSGADSYMYSFASTAVGDVVLTHVSETPKMFGSTFDVAIAELIEGMVDKEIDKKLFAVEE